MNLNTNLMRNIVPKFKAFPNTSFISHFIQIVCLNAVYNKIVKARNYVQLFCYRKLIQFMVREFSFFSPFSHISNAPGCFSVLSSRSGSLTRTYSEFPHSKSFAFFLFIIILNETSQNKAECYKVVGGKRKKSESETRNAKQVS